MYLFKVSLQDLQIRYNKALILSLNISLKIFFHAETSPAILIQSNPDSLTNFEHPNGIISMCYRFIDVSLVHCTRVSKFLEKLSQFEELQGLSRGGTEGTALFCPLFFFLFLSQDPIEDRNFVDQFWDQF